MKKRGPDFEAEVRFLTREEGGRSENRGPVRHGYRCDVHFDDDRSDSLWMIWPMFVDESGQELLKGTIVAQDSRANFYIITSETRRAIHPKWLRAGAKFHLSEGEHRVAACSVTKLFSSLEDP